VAEPILFVVGDDPDTLASLATALERRFGADYRILTDRSPSSALTRLEKARGGGEEVALVVADLWMPEMTGIEALARARDLFPRAARCVLVAFGDAAAYPLVRRALVLGQINTYLLKPWGHPEERLYPVVSEILAGWVRSTRPRVAILQIVGERWARRSHELRDLSERNSIPYGCARLYNRLDVDGVEGLVGKGVFYGAATAEAPALSGQDVFLVGGGNSAGQAAAHLARYAAGVTILVRGPSLSMSDYLVKQIGRTANIRIRFNTRILRAAGASRLDGLAVEDMVTGTAATLPASALFVLIGAGPHTGWLAGTVQRDDHGYIFTGSAVVRGDAGVPGWSLDRAPYLLETSLPGVLAAGDVRCRAPKGVAAAVGEGAIAIRSVREYLSEE
jgi:thioredoxin reductase/DNA-binding NarL/FixJ family response regulator